MTIASVWLRPPTPTKLRDEFDVDHVTLELDQDAIDAVGVAALGEPDPARRLAEAARVIGDGDGDSGFDRALHGDWDALFAIYRDKANELAQVDPNWRPPVVIQEPPPDPQQPAATGLQIGQQVFAQTVVNVRRTPGNLNKPDGDVFTMLAQGAAATVNGGPEARDGLTWWRIGVTMADGSTQDGWAAESVDGTPLLAAMIAPASRGLRQAMARG